jgi:hypothetical protein
VGRVLARVREHDPQVFLAALRIDRLWDMIFYLESGVAS